MVPNTTSATGISQACERRAIVPAPAGTNASASMVSKRAAQEAGAIHDRRAAFGDWAQQAGILARVVLQVGILDEDDVAGRALDRGAHRSALTTILRVIKDDQVIRLRQGCQQLARAIRR